MKLQKLKNLLGKDYRFEQTLDSAQVDVLLNSSPEGFTD